MNKSIKSTFAVVEPAYRHLEDYADGKSRARYLGSDSRHAEQLARSSMLPCDVLEIRYLTNGLVHVFTQQGVTAEREKTEHKHPDIVCWDCTYIDDFLQRLRA